MPSRGGWRIAAVVAVFFVHGLLFASWTAHIPHVKEHLHLGDGALGIALLGAPIGSIVAMFAAAYLLPRLGSRTMVRVSLVGYCAAGPVVGLAGSFATLFLALVLWGAFQGTLDVSMNTQAISVERAAGRPLMTGFHGTWSTGTFAGAALGTLGVALGLSLSPQLLILGTPCVLVAGWLTARMLPDAHPGRVADPASTSDQVTVPGGTVPGGTVPGGTVPGGTAPAPVGPDGNRRPRRSGIVQAAVLVLGAIAFADMLCEGAAADWSAVYLHGTLHVASGGAGIAYTAYSLAMVVVRLSGNRLVARLAVERLLPALAVLATVGFAVALLVNDAAAAVLGFACLGAGLGTVVPTVFSAAGRVPGIHAGSAVAAVSGLGWAGFLLGPPLLGQLAGATSLRTALCLLPVLTLVIAVSTARSRLLRHT